MSEDSQRETVAFLSRPETYGATGKVETIVTHISRVFMVGAHAYKLKRAVKFPYVDFTDAARRKSACESELALNRRTAPELYLDVIAVTRAGDGKLALNGEGEALDWLVRMRRFEQDALFDRLAQDGRLTIRHVDDLAEILFRFYDAAEASRERGGRAAIADVVDESEALLTKLGDGTLDADKIARTIASCRTQLDVVGPELDRRRAAGWVRRCHGDLHLRNIVLLDGRPTPFDCIEFNDAFAIIDVMYDLAFLLMDLEHRGLRVHANALLNRMLDHSGDFAATALLPLLLAVRATVRSHVAAAQDKTDEAASYLDLALSFLDPPAPRLIAVGGLSGSGKSSVARLIAPAVGAAPGAVVIRSDTTRKRLAGVGLFDRLGPDAYTPDMSARVYAALLDAAAAALDGGHSVILDAVYAKPEEREQARALAGRAGAPFHGLWLDVPLDVRTQRIGGRTKDASDATADVTRGQEDYDLGVIDWQVLDAAQDLESLEKQALAAL